MAEVHSFTAPAHLLHSRQMMMKRAVARIIATIAPPPAAPATTATGLETAAEIKKKLL